MKRLEENPRMIRLFAWSGPFLVACWIAALVGYGRFIPPKTPDASATAIAHFYMHHTTALRIDALALMLTGGFWATWGAAIATFIAAPAYERDRVGVTGAGSRRSGRPRSRRPGGQTRGP